MICQSSLVVKILICNEILDLKKNPKKFKKIGSELKDWFNKYNGNSLIKEYIKLDEGRCLNLQSNFY